MSSRSVELDFSDDTLFMSLTLRVVTDYVSNGENWKFNKDVACFISVTVPPI